MPFQSLKGEALFRYVQFLTAIKQRQFGARDGNLFQAGVIRRAVNNRQVAFTFVQRLEKVVMMQRADVKGHIGMQFPKARNRARCGAESERRYNAESKMAAPVRLDILDHLFKRSERSEEHTSELQSLMRISYAVF